MSVPRVYDSGIYRDATPEEIAAWEQSIADTQAPEPTTEERIAALDADMEANACDYEKLNALVAEKEAAQADLDALYLRWEELSEAAGEV